MIFFVDIFFIVGMLIFLVAALKLFMDNILTIILVIIVAAVVLFLMYKWPKATLVILVILLVISLIIIGVHNISQENNVTVTIYKAYADCSVYDRDENIVTIPAGAIVARYADPTERQNEGTNVHGFVNYCYWYYNGAVHQFYVSNSHNVSISGLPQSKWRLTEIKEITYKEFKKGDWMHVE